MVHCPHCESELTEADDVEFLDMDSTTGFLTAFEAVLPRRLRRLRRRHR